MAFFHFKSLVLMTMLLTVAGSAAAQQKVSPAVPGFGAVNPIPAAVKKPDPQLTYKVLVDLYEGADKPEAVVPGLTHTARMLNLHKLGGVPEENMQVVLVVHGPALPLVLTNEAYRSKFGIDNPNTPIIDALKKAGVQLFVCGQSMIARGHAFETLNPKIGLSISAMTVLTEYQLKNYALLKF